MQTTIEHFTISLCDDGTMDTVLLVIDNKTNRHKEIRFSYEVVERDDDGYILNFEELAEDALEGMFD